jgi:hypothetical protein
MGVFFSFFFSFFKKRVSSLAFFDSFYNHLFPTVQSILVDLRLMSALAVALKLRGAVKQNASFLVVTLQDI